MEELEFVSCSRREGYDSADDPSALPPPMRTTMGATGSTGKTEGRDTGHGASLVLKAAPKRIKARRGGIYACRQKGEMDGSKEVKDD
jgi:hypothetical protein